MNKTKAMEFEKSSQKIVFFGTPDFAVPTLKALHKEGYNIVLVVTQPDKPVGRKQVLTPSAVKVEGQRLGFEVIDDLKNLRSKIAVPAGRREDRRPVAGIVAAYGQIISKEILDIFPKGCLNIHPSLLPKYRGPSPIQAAILNGDEETGVSIIKLDEQMDHGGHVSRITYHVSSDDTCKSLSEKLADEGAKLLIKTLPDYLFGKIKPVPQDDSQATYTKILKRQDGEIDWNEPAIKIERQIRAYYPWPGSYAKCGTRNAEPETRNPKRVKIKILSVKIADDLSSAEIGKFQNIDGRLYVKCGQGALIIEKLQPEGKKEMSGQEFINGYFK